MAYKAVIFDLDGTLVHTMPEYRYMIVGRTLREIKGNPKKEYIDSFWFGANRNLIIKTKFKVNPDIFWKTYQSHDRKELRKKFTRPYEDSNIVKELRKKGLMTGIVTGAPIHIAELEISLLGRKNFDSIVIARESEGLKPKPHPASLEKCLSALDLKSSDALYVGNAHEDILMARKAKVKDVLVNRGEHPTSRLKPSISISRLDELRKYL